MQPFKYLDVDNHEVVSKKLYDLILNSLYKNQSPYGYSYLTFRPQIEGQEKYDIKTNNEFWNFLDYREVLDLIPELKQTLEQLDVTPLSIALLVVRKGYGQLHSDRSGHNTEMRINWPIVNCETTKTVFYKLKTTETIEKADPPSGEGNKWFFLYDPKDIEQEIGTYTLTKPIVFKFTVPHSVTVDFEKNTIPRMLLTIDFKSNTLTI